VTANMTISWPTPFRINGNEIKTIPIADAPKQTETRVITLVDRILAAKQREIDELVYALYGPTPEEIQIVEGTAK
jgi:hypothetical protein